MPRILRHVVMVAAAVMLAGVGVTAATTADAAPLPESLPMTAHGVAGTTSFTFTGGGGPTRAAVNPSESFALLETGSVCTSGGPSESAIIT